jgi:acetyl esterase/lipase
MIVWSCRMSRLPAVVAPLLIVSMLSACGGGAGSGGSGPGGTPLPVTSGAPPVTTPAPVAMRGDVVTPATVSAITLADGSSATTVGTAQMKALVASTLSQLTAVTSEPRCTVTTYTVRYNTAGPQDSLTQASAAIMLPGGTDPNCTGARPVMLYAHGTSLDKTYTMAKLTGESRLIAAMFAAQGFIVVAPNYTGYDSSTLAYHPYLDASLQAADMIDALRAARTSFGTLGASQSTRLFVAGYSQGGYVALATQKAMQALPTEFSITAVAGMSGPYALSQFADNVFAGNPGQGITAFLPLITTAGQRAGAGIYGAPSDLYEAPYAAGIETVLPGTLSSGELVAQGRLPATALFARDAMPQPQGAGVYFGAGNLVRTAYRNAYLADAAAHPCNMNAGTPLACAPQNALRQWVVRNDLRSFTPVAPLLLCGGKEDPTVPFSNTRDAAAYFKAVNAMPTVVDLDTGDGLNDRWLVERAGFNAAKLAVKADAATSGKSVSDAMADTYHAGLVAPFCLLAARDFFKDRLP